MFSKQGIDKGPEQGTKSRKRNPQSNPGKEIRYQIQERKSAIKFRTINPRSNPGKEIRSQIQDNKSAKSNPRSQKSSSVSGKLPEERPAAVQPPLARPLQDERRPRDGDLSPGRVSEILKKLLNFFEVKFHT